jgi:hypothetical protein
LEHLELQEMGTDADSTANKYDYIATFLVYKTAWRNLKPKPLEPTRDLSWPNGQDKATSVAKQRNQRDSPAPKKAQETDFRYLKNPNTANAYKHYTNIDGRSDFRWNCGKKSPLFSTETSCAREKERKHASHNVRRDWPKP